MYKKKFNKKYGKNVENYKIMKNIKDELNKLIYIMFIDKVQFFYSKFINFI